MVIKRVGVKLPTEYVEPDPQGCEFFEPAPDPRCTKKRPQGWPASASAITWLQSGGSVLVFGLCTPRDCPKVRERSD